MSNDLVNGTTGNDVIDAGGGNDTVNAGAGDDVIYQTDMGSDAVDGGEGTDRLVLDYSGETSDWVIGGRGIWVYYYDADGNYLNRGAVGYEVAVPATTGRWGFHSNHYGVTYSGIEQFDITGTGWADLLIGGAQADVLRGGGGSDVLEGGGGNDTLEGGDGDDVLRAGSNPQQIDGGSGTDTLLVDLSAFGGDLVWINDPTKTVTLANGLTVGGVEALKLTTGAGNDELRNTLVGTSDTLTTGDGNDVIDAGGGNDTVNAGAGDDVIYQKDRGSDAVDGGEGTDHLVLDYSGETSDWVIGGRGIWVYYYDADGNYLKAHYGFRVVSRGPAPRGIREVAFRDFWCCERTRRSQGRKEDSPGIMEQPPHSSAGLGDAATPVLSGELIL